MTSTVIGCIIALVFTWVLTSFYVSRLERRIDGQETQEMLYDQMKDFEIGKLLDFEIGKTLEQDST